MLVLVETSSSGLRPGRPYDCGLGLCALPRLQHAPPGDAAVSADWTQLRVARDGTHHVADGRPAYVARFERVLTFHAPGLAPARDVSGAFHIGPDGREAYARRFLETFGFYEGRAAVQDETGWLHVLPNGRPLYGERYDWCGNFQEGRCTVRTREGRYLHLAPDGSAAYNERHRYAGDYRDGAAVVQADDGRSTHIDPDGHPLHGRWFLDLDVFHKGYARARDEEPSAIPQSPRAAW
jgi:hypothetical protein